jgi:1,4-dihydroxy-2-naphthoate polyprenyltransferase
MNPARAAGSRSTRLAARWLHALQTTNVPEGAEIDPVSKWLIATRASVLPMTLFAAGIGGLTAIADGPVSLGLWMLCTLGLLLAHVANNLMNDYFDVRSGVDTPDYARAQYAPHPILSGLVSAREMLGAIALVNGLGLAIALILTAARGPTALVFALAGFALSLFYVAPPLKLKHRGLGEPSVFVIWGPLMVAGSYFIASGTLPLSVWLASIPYGLLVTAVLFGKHIDKLSIDAAKGIRTLPVILGPERARIVARGLIVAFYAIVALEVAAGVLTPWAVLVGASLPRANRVLRAFRASPPAQPPPGYPLWPLWYVAAAFALVRQAGALLVLGLLLAAILPG